MLMKLINRILGQAARMSTLEPERLPALPRTSRRNRCRWLSAPMWRPPVNPHRSATKRPRQVTDLTARRIASARR